MAQETGWQFNASAGVHILRVSRNERIVRHQGGRLYTAEFWGDYSLAYPVRGPCRATLQQAKRDLSNLRNATTD